MDKNKGLKMHVRKLKFDFSKKSVSNDDVMRCYFG